MLLLQSPELRTELVKKLYLQDQAKLSQVCVLAHRELDKDIERAAAHVAQLVEEEALNQRNDHHIENLVLEEQFLGWYSDW